MQRISTCHSPDTTPTDPDADALGDAVREIEAQAMIGEQDVAAVARNLGLSERTLQRRIAAEGQTFRALLTEVRQELGRQLLTDLSIRGKGSLPAWIQDANSF
jgi:AraC-like DNA-binding protein